MKPLEKVLLVFAIMAILIVAGFYAMTFFARPLSLDSNDWAALGEYFGGLLGPILTFILIILVLEEARAARNQFDDSRTLQVKTQAQVTEQIELIRPKPELVYYLSSIGKLVSGVLENIGNATAYRVVLTVSFDTPPDRVVLSQFNDLSHFDYLPPNYRAVAPMLGHFVLDRTITGLGPHAITVKYSDTPEPIQTSRDYVKSYTIDEHMIRTLENKEDPSRALSSIVTEIRKLAERPAKRR